MKDKKRARIALDLQMGGLQQEVGNLVLLLFPQGFPESQCSRYLNGLE